MDGHECLHVGIDARNASNPRPGGFRTYVLGLLGGFAQIETRHVFDLYFDRAVEGPIPSGGARNRTRVVSSVSRLVQENWALPRRMMRDGLDVAFFPGNVLPAMRLGCATVVTVHDAIQLQKIGSVLAESHGIRQGLINLYFAARVPSSARAATIIITVSQHARGEISRLLQIPPERIVVTYNGVNREVFRMTDKRLAQLEVRERFGLDPDYVLAIGSSDRRKNLAAVLAAYAALPQDLRKRHALVFVLANTHLRAELEAQAHALGVYDRLAILTRLRPVQLSSLYNAAVAYVSPSLYESCPLTVLEAMACGTPLLVSNTTSLPEIVGDAGLMADPHSTDELRQQLQRLLEDNALRARYRRLGLERSKMFRWEEAARKTCEAFEVADQLHRNRVRGRVP